MKKRIRIVDNFDYEQKNYYFGGIKLYNHAPEGYICPFCLVAKEAIKENIHGLEESDIVYRDDFITAFIPHGWWDNNKGHVIIIPNPHFENLYELPAVYSAKIHGFEKEIAIVFKEVYKCVGVIYFSEQKRTL